MSEAAASKGVSDLVKLLRGLSSLHEELLKVIRSKTDAMRKAEIGKMREFGEKECTIAARIHEREGFRRQMMEGIGRQIGLPAQTARRLPLSQVSSRLPVDQREALTQAASGLRGRMTRVAAANRVAGAMAREISQHLRSVFAAVRPRGGASAGYSGAGVALKPVENELLDAVG